MKKAWIRALAVIAISFLFLSMASTIALKQQGDELKLLAGAALEKGDKALSPAGLAQALKINQEQLRAEGEGFLRHYGYLDLRYANKYKLVSLNLALAFLLGLISLVWSVRQEKKLRSDLLALSDYLYAIRQGDDRLILQDDIFSRLRDELYKTILAWRESREKAQEDRETMKENMEDITHQIKTPLTNMQLMLDLVQEDERNQAEYIERLQREIERLNRLTTALLKLSSLDAGAVTFRRECFSAEDMVREAMQPIEDLIRQKRLELQIGGQDFAIIGDRSWLMEAILNVVKNAVEAVDEKGRVTIELSENDIYQSIVVNDNGPGIPPEDLRHIFERFYKSSHSKQESFGIGLPMAKSIVEAHDGSLGLKNKDSGSRLEIKLYPPVTAGGEIRPS